MSGLDDTLTPGRQADGRGATAAATAAARSSAAKVRIDTPVELDYYRNGGILQTVLRKLLAS